MGGLVALTIALGVSAGPAQAAPAIQGDYAKGTHKVLSPVVPDQNRELIRFNYNLDLQGLGAEWEKNGYLWESYSGREPIFTKVDWRVDVTVKGPGNYYYTDYWRTWSPNDTLEWTFAPSGYKFAGGQVKAGTYEIEHRLSATSSRIGNDVEPHAERTLYTKEWTQRISLKDATVCPKANEQVKKAQATVTKAKKAVKKARGKKSVKKAKATLTKAKKSLSKAKVNRTAKGC